MRITELSIMCPDSIYDISHSIEFRFKFMKRFDLLLEKSIKTGKTGQLRFFINAFKDDQLKFALEYLKETLSKDRRKLFFLLKEAI